MSHACHRLWKCYKTLTFCYVLLTFDKVHNPLRLSRGTTSERPKVVFSTFWLRNVLRATKACTFSTSQLPKVVRSWCVFYIVTSKCVSGHNGVHFFDISTSKSGPELRCFAHFDLEICFAPQQRALFRHLNFQKCSEREVSWTFSLADVLRATTACNFSSLIWPDGSESAALASLLFDPPEPQIILEKHSVSRLRDFPTFSRTCIFFLLTLSLWSSLFYSSLFSESSHLCFSSVHIVGSLTSKLPWVTYIHMIIFLFHLRPIAYLETLFIWNPTLYLYVTHCIPVCNLS